MSHSEPIDQRQSWQREQLLKFLPKLNKKEQSNLLDQLEKLSPATVHKQQVLLKAAVPPSLEYTALQDYSLIGNREDIQLGEQLIQEGKVACLIIAGGQGTRLQFSGPKGLCPVTPFRKHTLFQLAAEKVLAASRWTKKPLQLAIMTSPLNDSETRSYFSKERFFGLAETQVHFFAQEMLPLLSREGQIFLDQPGHIAEGPNGNGEALKILWESGIGPKWSSMGIQMVNTIFIDNPLADPFDRELCGFHWRHNDDVTLKAVFREDPSESVGVIVQTKTGPQVIEYTELSAEERNARGPDGQLKHRCANLSLFCFRLDFIAKIAQIKLPLHLALKSAPFVDENGVIHSNSEPNSWKFETFIFDVLPHATRCHTLIFPRDECFSPLKNLKGMHSLSWVQAALTKRERQILVGITDTICPSEIVEIDPQFYYPTVDIKKKWQGQSIPLKPFIAAI